MLPFYELTVRDTETFKENNFVKMSLVYYSQNNFSFSIRLTAKSQNGLRKTLTLRKTVKEAGALLQS